jgi:hypothetical protein
MATVVRNPAHSANIASSTANASQDTPLSLGTIACTGLDINSELNSAQHSSREEYAPNASAIDPAPRPALGVLALDL